MTTDTDDVQVVDVPASRAGRLTEIDLERARNYVSRPDLTTREGLLDWVGALLAETTAARVGELGGMAARTIDSAEGSDPGTAGEHLPDGYHLVVAIRDTDKPCDRCGDEDESDPHMITEMAVVTRLDPEQTLSALSAAMRHVGNQAGIGVGFADPRQLMAAMAMSMGMDPRAMGRPEPEDDQPPAANTGQYL